MRNLSFAKIMILMCFVGSIALGYLDWQNYQKIKDMETKLAEGGAVENLVRETQQIGKEYGSLRKDLSGDGMAGLDNAMSYFIRIGDLQEVAMGGLEITPNESKDRRTGVTDTVYTIRPQTRDRHYTRTSLTNFLYKVEEGSPRIRITQFQMTNQNQDGKARVEPTEYPKDLFSFSCKVTSREKEEVAAN